SAGRGTGPRGSQETGPDARGSRGTAQGAGAGPRPASHGSPRHGRDLTGYLARDGPHVAMGNNSLPDLLGRLQTWLATYRPRFAAALNPGATPTQLGALEAAIGMKLPQPLRELLAWHNGQRPGFVGGFERNWLLMSTQTITAAKPDLDAGAATTGWHPSWLPVFDDDAGDYLCLDTALAECPVRAFYLGNNEHSVVAPSLDAWFADFVTNVERGEYVEEPERGTFTRKSDGDS